MAQSSNHPATRNTWGQSPVITRQTCAPANITFLQCTLQTWDAEQQLCQFFVYGRFQTTPCNMLLHNQVLAFISLSWLWKRNMTNIFQQKEQCISKYASGCACLYIYSCIYKNNLKGGEKYPGTWTNCVTENNCRLCPNKAYLLCNALMLFCFPGNTAAL